MLSEVGWGPETYYCKTKWDEGLRSHFLDQNTEFLLTWTFKLVGKNLNWEGLGPLVVNIKLLLIAVVRMYCCVQKMLKKKLNR